MLAAFSIRNHLVTGVQTFALPILAVDETVSCDYVVAHTDAGSYDNTAKVTVSDNEGNNASDEGSRTRLMSDHTPTAYATKWVKTSTLAEPGWSFTCTFKIYNTSVEPVTIDALSYDNTSSHDCFALSLHDALPI